MRRALLALAAFAVMTGSAAAQTTTPPPQKGTSGSSIGLRAYGVVDGNSMAALDSFDAVFGTRQLTAAGGGAEVNVWKGLFLRIAVTQMNRTGSRVFVGDNKEVFDLHIPMKVTMTPIEAGGGWRLASHSRFSPYIGGAFISLDYQQVSDFAQAGENVNERYTGGAAFGGVDVTIWKGIFVGGEAQFRHISVPDASSSVMHEFGETDLGGFTGRLRIGFAIK